MDTFYVVVFFENQYMDSWKNIYLPKKAWENLPKIIKLIVKMLRKKIHFVSKMMIDFK